MLGHTFNTQAVDNWALAFTSCLCGGWWSAWGKSLQSSQILPGHVESPGHVHSPMHTFGLLDSLYYVGAFQNPKKISFPCSTFCLPQLLSSTSRSHKNNQLPLTVFNKALHTGQLPIRSNKDSLASGGLQGVTDKSNNDISLGIWLWKNSNPILPPPGAARWLVFTVVAGCWFLSLL